MNYLSDALGNIKIRRKLRVLISNTSDPPKQLKESNHLLLLLMNIKRVLLSSTIGTIKASQENNMFFYVFYTLYFPR